VEHHPAHRNECREERRGYGSARGIRLASRAFGLNSLTVRFIAAPNRNTPMLALGVIFAFVIIIGAINYFEFGSVD